MCSFLSEVFSQSIYRKSQPGSVVFRSSILSVFVWSNCQPQIQENRKYQDLEVVCLVYCLYLEEEDLYLFLDQKNYRINLSRKYRKDISYLVSIWSIGISIVPTLKLSTTFFMYGSTGNRSAKRGGPKRLAEAYSSPWHSSQTAL